MGAIVGIFASFANFVGSFANTRRLTRYEQTPSQVREVEYEGQKYLVITANDEKIQTIFVKDEQGEFRRTDEVYAESVKEAQTQGTRGLESLAKCYDATLKGIKANMLEDKDSEKYMKEEQPANS